MLSIVNHDDQRTTGGGPFKQPPHGPEHLIGLQRLPHHPQNPPHPLLLADGGPATTLPLTSCQSPTGTFLLAPCQAPTDTLLLSDPRSASTLPLPAYRSPAGALLLVACCQSTPDVLLLPCSRSPTGPLLVAPSRSPTGVLLPSNLCRADALLPSNLSPTDALLPSNLSPTDALLPSNLSPTDALLPADRDLPDELRQLRPRAVRGAADDHDRDLDRVLLQQARGKPGLADARRPDHGHQPAGPVGDDLLERLPELVQLLVAAHERDRRPPKRRRIAPQPAQQPRGRTRHRSGVRLRLGNRADQAVRAPTDQDAPVGGRLLELTRSLEHVPSGRLPPRIGRVPANRGAARNVTLDRRAIRNVPVNRGVVRNGKTLNWGAVRYVTPNWGAVRCVPLNRGGVRYGTLNRGAVRNAAVGRGVVRNVRLPRLDAEPYRQCDAVVALHLRLPGSERVAQLNGGAHRPGRVVLAHLAQPEHPRHRPSGRPQHAAAVPDDHVGAGAGMRIQHAVQQLGVQRGGAGGIGGENGDEPPGPFGFRRVGPMERVRDIRHLRGLRHVGGLGHRRGLRHVGGVGHLGGVGIRGLRHRRGALCERCGRSRQCAGFP
ncbi:unnamed protein product [[Actinomadura] parvosata subsp. kistnae]|nr:unnamed protein product [Actinomadura parvosata subsp. kistnae]